jgi:hypothetical protein
MEVGRVLVYPHHTVLDDVEIDTSSYAVVKVDMVHDTSGFLWWRSIISNNLDQLPVKEKPARAWAHHDDDGVDPGAVGSNPGLGFFYF